MRTSRKKAFIAAVAVGAPRLRTTQARRPPLIQGSIGPEGHWFTTQGKQLALTNPIGTDRPGKTPRQKRTTASTINSHYSLMVELRLRATTRVDHPGYATHPQIGVRSRLYPDSSQQCETQAPAGGQYSLKLPGDTSPAWLPSQPKSAAR